MPPLQVHEGAVRDRAARQLPGVVAGATVYISGITRPLAGCSVRVADRRVRDGEAFAAYFDRQPYRSTRPIRARYERSRLGDTMRLFVPYSLGVVLAGGTAYASPVRASGGWFGNSDPSPPLTLNHSVSRQRWATQALLQARQSPALRLSAAVPLSTAPRQLRSYRLTSTWSQHHGWDRRRAASVRMDGFRVRGCVGAASHRSQPIPCSPRGTTAIIPSVFRSPARPASMSECRRRTPAALLRPADCLG